MSRSRKQKLQDKKVREKTTSEKGKVKPMVDKAETKILEALERGQTQRQMMLIEEATPDGKVISLEVKPEKDQPEVVLTDREGGWRDTRLRIRQRQSNGWLCC